MSYFRYRIGIVVFAAGVTLTVLSQEFVAGRFQGGFIEVKDFVPDGVASGRWRWRRCVAAHGKIALLVGCFGCFGLITGFGISHGESVFLLCVLVLGGMMTASAPFSVTEL